MNFDCMPHHFPRTQVVSSRPRSSMKMLSFILYAAVMQFYTSTGYGLPVKNAASPCDPSRCKLPDCFCSGTKIPGDLDAKSIPQMVMVSFDDAVNEQVYGFETSLFDGTLLNPNQCPTTATFFVSHEWTDYQMMQTLYHNRHEIADHTISHRLPVSWWKNATEHEWKQEIMGMREILRKWGNIPVEEVKGFRAPFLQIGGENEFKVLHDGKFTFESSMPTQNSTNPPMWPYTLDYKSTQECVIPPCPTESYPGLWEVPMIDYTDRNGQPCNMIDGCAPPTSRQQTYELIHRNFLRHYKSNRAPFPMFMHAGWFQDHPERLEGVKDFMKNVSSLGDVYFITISQVIEWIKHPTTLDKIKEFIPWKCGTPRPPVCSRAEMSVCPYPNHYLFTCTKPCPNHYPWVGNPDGN